MKLTAGDLVKISNVIGSMNAANLVMDRIEYDDVVFTLERVGFFGGKDSDEPGVLVITKIE